MKTLFNSMTLFVTLFFSGMASATSVEIHQGLFTSLTEIHLAQDFPYPQNYPFTGGNIAINVKAKKVYLNLYGPVSPCPTGAACFFPSYNTAIKMDLVDVNHGHCGTTYTARTIRSGQGGGIVETLVVTDYSRSLCNMVFPAPTVVEYFYHTGRPEKLGGSFFYGDTLRAL